MQSRLPCKKLLGRAILFLLPVKVTKNQCAMERKRLPGVTLRLSKKLWEVYEEGFYAGFQVWRLPI
jgi:hypothetical protein